MAKPHKPLQCRGCRAVRCRRSHHQLRVVVVGMWRCNCSVTAAAVAAVVGGTQVGLCVRVTAARYGMMWSADGANGCRPVNEVQRATADHAGVGTGWALGAGLLPGAALMNLAIIISSSAFASSRSG